MIPQKDIKIVLENGSEQLRRLSVRQSFLKLTEYEHVFAENSLRAVRKFLKQFVQAT